MKNTLVVIALLWSIFASAQTKSYKIQKIDFKDARLLSEIDAYNQEFGDAIKETRAALILRYVKDEQGKFFIAFKVYKIEVTQDPPSFYFFHKGQLILVYTGFESFMTFSESSFKELFRDSKEFLYLTDITYDPIPWEIVLQKNGGYKKTMVERLPW